MEGENTTRAELLQGRLLGEVYDKDGVLWGHWTARGADAKSLANPQAGR